MQGYSNKCGDYEIEIYHDNSGGRIVRHYNSSHEEGFSIRGVDTRQSLEDLRYIISQAIKYGYD